MKKRLLKTLALSVLAQCTFAQTLPTNPLYEFSHMGGFISKGRTTNNEVTKQSDPDYATDRFGNPLGATSLSGNSYVEIEGTGLDFGRVANQSRSYSVWVKLASKTTTQNIFTKARRNWTGSAHFDYGLTFDRNSGFIVISGPSNDNTNYYKSGVKPAVGKWTHIVMVVESTGATTGSKKVYIDGVKKLDATFASKGQAYTGEPLIIGKSKSTSLQYTGDIDDLFIYDRALTDADVSNLFNATEVDYSSYPSLDLRFDGNYADSSIYDNKVSFSGLSFREDRHGNANGAVYQSDALSSVLKVEDAKTLDFGTGSDKAYALSFWFKHLNNNDSKTFSILTKAVNNWSGSAQFDYGVFKDKSEMVPFTGPSSDPVNYPRNKFSSNDTLWHHLVISCNQTGTKVGTKTIYFDGQEVFSGTYNNKGIARDYDLVFGRGKAGIEPFEGLYDDVLIYQKALTATDVDNIFRTNHITSTGDVLSETSLMHVYPNPTTDVINVSNGLGKAYTLTNTFGNIIETGIISENGIDLTAAESGVYFITINGNKNTDTFKVIKD